jgi:hypothetical protein
MPTPSLQNIVDIVKSQRLKGATTACLDREMKVVHRMIVAMLPDIRQTLGAPASITLVDNQRDYEVPEKFVQIACVVLANATDQKILTPKKFQFRMREQTSTSKPWITGADSGAYANVTEYSVIGVAASASTTKQMIVLNKPLTTATGHTLKVYGAEVEDTFALSSLISPMLLSEAVYIEGLSWRVALEVRPEVAPAYFQAFMSAVQMEKELVKTFIEGLNESESQHGNVRM